MSNAIIALGQLMYDRIGRFSRGESGGDDGAVSNGYELVGRGAAGES